MPPSSFAQSLREARTKAGLSQAALGKKAGLTAPYISLLESGQRRAPSHGQVERLAKALGLDPAPWVEQAALERAPEPVQRRVEGLDRERVRVTRARDRILTTTLYRVAHTPGLMEALGDSPEEIGGFRHLVQMLSARLRGVGSAREAEKRSAEILDKVSSRERDRLVEALPAVLAADVPAPEAPGAPRPRSLTLEVRESLAPDAPAADHVEVDVRWAVPGAFAWRLDADDGWPRLGAGDLLLLDPSAEPRDGDLVALRHGGHDLVRTLRRRGAGEVLLEGLRVDTPPLRIATGAFHPAGVVTHVLRSVR